MLFGLRRTHTQVKNISATLQVDAGPLRSEGIVAYSGLMQLLLQILVARREGIQLLLPTLTTNLLAIAADFLSQAVSSIVSLFQSSADMHCGQKQFTDKKQLPAKTRSTSPCLLLPGHDARKHLYNII